MTYWTETAIAQKLEGKFFHLRQVSQGKFEVVDLNQVPEEDRPTSATQRWSITDLASLVALKRQGKTHAQCGEMLNRTEWAVMDKWQNRAEWMREVHVPRSDPLLLLDEIARVVCGVYGVSKAEFMSIRRLPRIVEARHMFFWIARRFTSFSLPQIGHFCGRKDHSTVMHGYRKIDQMIDKHRTNIELVCFDLGLSLIEQEAA